MAGRKSLIGVRLDTSDAKLMRKICKSRGEDLSDFVRRAIRTEMAKLDFLKPADKQALGIDTEKTNRKGGGKN
jgi:uncharacterized protein (DUF1778 family)